MKKNSWSLRNEKMKREKKSITEMINRMNKKSYQYRFEAPSILNLDLQSSEWGTICWNVSPDFNCHGKEEMISNIARSNVCRVFGSKSTSWVSLGSTCSEPCRCNLLHPANTSEQMSFYTMHRGGLFLFLWMSCLWL